MESKHPFVEDTKLYFGKHFGKYGGYAVEFIILVGALAHSDTLIVAAVYALYSSLNVATAYLLINRKL